MPERLVYLDHAATTPMRAAAVEAMLPFLTDRFANPSGSYRFAREMRRAVDDARDAIAERIGCRPDEVVFTSGGTEADNTVIAGASAGGRAVCSAVEHHAVLEAVERVHGAVVAVDPAGHVDLDRLRSTLVARTSSTMSSVSVVSIMAVNNEVGTVTDLAAVADVVRQSAPGAVFHTDAVQAAPWLDLRDVWARVDSLSLSAHKFGGPKGVGVLAVRRGARVAPLLVGGGQERDRRSGTPNVAGIVAMAVALAETDANRAADVAAVAARRDRLIAGLTALGGVRETVAPALKVAGAAHVCIDGVENEALLYLLDQAGVCASAASACAAGAMEPSHVLAAMGVDRHVARGAVRFTLGHTTTDDDVEAAISAAVGAIGTLRERAASGAAMASAGRSSP